jgi:hypothetical protein
MVQGLELGSFTPTVVARVKNGKTAAFGALRNTHQNISNGLDASAGAGAGA